MKRAPGCRIAGTELETLDQFQPRNALEHEQHGRLVYRAAGDLHIAALLRLDIQRVDRRLLPEGLVVERLQPFLHIIHVVEHLHPQERAGTAPQNANRTRNTEVDHAFKRQ